MGETHWTIKMQVVGKKPNSDMFWNPASWHHTRFYIHCMTSKQVISIEFGYSGCGWIIRLKPLKRTSFFFSKWKTVNVFVTSEEQFPVRIGKIICSVFSEAMDSFPIGTGLCSWQSQAQVDAHCPAQTDSLQGFTASVLQLPWTPNCFSLCSSRQLVWALQCLRHPINIPDFITWVLIVKESVTH